MPRHRWRGGRRRRGPLLRGFMEPCLLLLLHRGPGYGYDLAQGLDELGIREVDPSLVYRMLRGLEEQGLVISRWDTDSSSGPARRVYSLTDLGDRALLEWVAELRETDRVLHAFVQAYEDHMENAAGAYHD